MRTRRLLTAAVTAATMVLVTAGTAAADGPLGGEGGGLLGKGLLGGILIPGLL